MVFNREHSVSFWNFAIRPKKVKYDAPGFGNRSGGNIDMHKFLKISIVVWLAWGCPYLCLAQTGGVKGSGVLTVQGGEFLFDNKPFDMWGIRVASASQTDELTDHLIAQLDDYLAHGVNTVDVFLQGSSGGYSDAFLDEGKKIDRHHLRRIKRIIEACRSRNMVVIVGIFYQRTMANSTIRNISTADGVRNAVRTVATALRKYRNIILNIANEQNSGYYRNCRFFDFNNPENIIELCRLSKSAAPEMLVGAGGYHDEKNIVIGRSPDVDVLLFDTFSEDVDKNQHSLWHYDLFRANGVTGKPIVNVEMFGAWTARFMPPGVYDETGKQKHFVDVDEAARTPGLYVHFHSNPWCQGPSIDMPARFDLGGSGSATEPGIRWWFEYVRDRKDRKP